MNAVTPLVALCSLVGGMSIILLVAAGASEAAPPAPEPTWRDRLAEGLNSPDPADRHAAAQGLATLGSEEVRRRFLPDASTAPDVLEEVLSAMLQTEARSVVDALLPGATPAQRLRLDGLRERWRTEATVQALVARLHADEREEGAQVVKGLKDLGRKALPALVQVLQRADPSADGEANRWIVRAIQDLAVMDDLPLLLPLLAHGPYYCRVVCLGLRATTVSEALVRSVEERGIGGYDLAALRPYQQDGAVQDALRVWLRRNGAHFWADDVAQWLVEAQAPGITRTLREVLEEKDAVRRHGLAFGLILASFGDTRGLETVLDALPGQARTLDDVREPYGLKEWSRAEALLIHLGAPAAHAPVAIRPAPYTVRANELRAWWLGVKDRLRWEASEHRWVLPEQPPR